MQVLLRAYCASNKLIFPNIKNARSFSCLTSTVWSNNEPKRRQITLQSRRQFSWDQTVTGIWKTLSNSTPVACVQQSLIQIHDFTGLPWWGTIILTTVLFRTAVTLPLAIYQHKIVARLENITLEMPDIANELKKEVGLAIRRYKWTEQQAQLMYKRSLKKQWNNLIVRDNCHPVKTLIVLWGQIPLWIFQSVALRNLVYMLPDPSLLDARLVFAELTVGGFGWIPNLTEVDSSYILPVILGVINLSIIQMQSMLRTRPSTRLQKYATNAFRVLSVGMIPIASSVPSCLCLYWLTSSAYGLAQNMILVTPAVRRAMGIPKTKSEIIHPYQHLMESLKKLSRYDEVSSKNAAK